MHPHFSAKIAILLTALCGLPSSIAAQPIPSARVIAACEACHGAGGDSKKSDVPRLNGQQEAYLKIRLRELLDPTRGTPHATTIMWENAQGISDEQAAELARYFSRQMPTKPNGMGPFADRGGVIFRKGAEPDIPACSVCHGADGGGLANVPRIAGQHEKYLSQQLLAFNLAVRAGSPMNRHAWGMDLGQIRALSIFLSKD